MSDRPRTVRIRLWGIVQGVGMRPLTVRLARSMGLAGTVRNQDSLVEIQLHASPAEQDTFLQRLRDSKPEPAVFVRQHVAEIAPRRLPRPFAILPSRGPDREPEPAPEAAGLAFPAPDLPVCAACERELADADNRRTGHPFISCMHCGPRYSILDRLPYDRATTAMRDFPLCPACAREYSEPADRRYHAQTVACPDCGPVLSWSDRSAPDPVFGAEALTLAIQALQAGQVIAVKATGGFHLACDPTQPEAVTRLRGIKQRDRKPFAVLFPDLASLDPYALVSDPEASLLAAAARPIVLLSRKSGSPAAAGWSGPAWTGSGEPESTGPAARPLAADVCGQSAYLGAMLPSTPVQILLAQACGPLVMTSANPSGENLVYQDEAMFDFWQAQPALAGLLGHNRPIRTGLDDSVARICNGRTQLIRRARGYVPLAVDLGLAAGPTVLACGGDLKATAALARDGFAWLTQPAGDLDSVLSQETWQAQVSRLQTILGLSPGLLAVDLHPGYHSRRQACFLSQQGGLPLQGWQHHQAHIASVLAEHQLRQPVIGVAFDGTGFGSDGTVWGGEFLVCSGTHFDRLACLQPVLLPGGDAGMRDAWRSLAGYLLAAGLPVPVWLAEPADPRWPVVQAALRNRINCLPNSSLGRLFDAVCALLGLGEVNTFEGDCATRLEAMARLAQARGWPAEPLAFEIEPFSDPAVRAAARRQEASARPLLAAIIAALAPLCQSGSGSSLADASRRQLVARLALGFHEAVCQMTVTLCAQLAATTGIWTIAVSGGVFQNGLLTEITDDALTRRGFRVYWNEQVPPNDSGLCLGQAWLSQVASPGTAVCEEERNPHVSGYTSPRQESAAPSSGRC